MGLHFANPAFPLLINRDMFSFTASGGSTISTLSLQASYPLLSIRLLKSAGCLERHIFHLELKLRMQTSLLAFAFRPYRESYLFTCQLETIFLRPKRFHFLCIPKAISPNDRSGVSSKERSLEYSMVLSIRQ